MMKKYDIAIIGGGIIGLAIAYFLLRPIIVPRQPKACPWSFSSAPRCVNAFLLLALMTLPWLAILPRMDGNMNGHHPTIGKRAAEVLFYARINQQTRKNSYNLTRSR
jgi:glycine/D-amino acid oxidase-like deaminating enzyme